MESDERMTEREILSMRYKDSAIVELCYIIMAFFSSIKGVLFNR
jgi:hypothetical protein